MDYADLEAALAARETSVCVSNELKRRSLMKLALPLLFEYMSLFMYTPRHKTAHLGSEARSMSAM